MRHVQNNLSMAKEQERRRKTRKELEQKQLQANHRYLLFRLFILVLAWRATLQPLTFYCIAGNLFINKFGFSECLVTSESNTN